MHACMHVRACMRHAAALTPIPHHPMPHTHGWLAHTDPPPPRARATPQPAHRPACRDVGPAGHAASSGLIPTAAAAGEGWGARRRRPRIARPRPPPPQRKVGVHRRQRAQGDPARPGAPCWVEEGEEGPAMRDGGRLGVWGAGQSSMGGTGCGRERRHPPPRTRCLGAAQAGRWERAHTYAGARMHTGAGCPTTAPGTACTHACMWARAPPASRWLPVGPPPPPALAFGGRR